MDQGHEVTDCSGEPLGGLYGNGWCGRAEIALLELLEVPGGDPQAHFLALAERA
jgi:hypothetical protein